MIFVLTIINNVNNIYKNENHWSLLITRYSLLITHYLEYKHPNGCTILSIAAKIPVNEQAFTDVQMY